MINHPPPPPQPPPHPTPIPHPHPHHTPTVAYSHDVDIVCPEYFPYINGKNPLNVRATSRTTQRDIYSLSPG